MPLVLLLIIIFIVPEDSLEYMLGAILGGGYGILMVIAFVAILYGIYKFFSEWKSLAIQFWIKQRGMS